VKIIGKSNDVGLARDLVLLAGAFRSCGYQVSVIAIDANQTRRRRSLWRRLRVRAVLMMQRLRASEPAPNEINVMLEHVWSEYLPAARRSIVIPNPEWFDSHDRSFLRDVDVIWAKTAIGRRIFDDLGCSTVHIGFDSEDRYDASVPRERFFLHLAGKSSMKGTQRLLRIWEQHPHWPKLLVLQHNRSDADSVSTAANVELRLGYVDDGELKALQNAALFHVCPSTTEGWGHYIVEAMSVGAVTITVDAEPMNELINVERGLLVPYSRTGKQRLATTYLFDEAAFAATIETILGRDDASWQECRANARRWFLRNKQGFPERLRIAVEECSTSYVAASAAAV
jgi:glycosyltransferase involved in cell wall biosynthesis